MASILAQRVSTPSRAAVSRPRARGSFRLPAVNGGTKWTMSADRPMWLPGNSAPAYLNGTLPGDYGFDPLGLGADPERLAWFAESERVHCRWAMLGVAGILAQNIVRPDVFWYTSGADTKFAEPYGIIGLVSFELFAMHFVETMRVQDFKNPGSVDQDPIFRQNKLAKHDVGYPGFAFFVPGEMSKLKVNEIKNGRLAMLAFIGFTMAAQTTGLNPLEALGAHLADPLGTTMFSKAAVVPGSAVFPPCQIPATVNYQGLTIPAGCFLQGLWP